MEELLEKLAYCVEFVKINLDSPYSPDIRWQVGTEELTTRGNNITQNHILGIKGAGACPDIYITNNTIVDTQVGINMEYGGGTGFNISGNTITAPTCILSGTGNTISSNICH